MMTLQEEKAEFWMLTKGILQDSKIETEEAMVLKRWLEEHKRGTEFDLTLKKIDKLLADGWIDRFESKELIDSLGYVLKILNGK